MDAWVLGEIMDRLLKKGKEFSLENILIPIGLGIENKEGNKEPE